jgi:hypothetical protein
MSGPDLNTSVTHAKMPIRMTAGGYEFMNNITRGGHKLRAGLLGIDTSFKSVTSAEMSTIKMGLSSPEAIRSCHSNEMFSQ